jgi:hypothetical protein
MQERFKVEEGPYDKRPSAKRVFLFFTRSAFVLPSSLLILFRSVLSKFFLMLPLPPPPPLLLFSIL